MTYLAYERSAGTSVLRSVETYCRHLTTGGTFSTSGIPPLVEVERYIDQTYYELQATLAREGYATAVTVTPALGVLEDLNAVGAALKVELAHPITGNRGEPNDRYKAFLRRWHDGTAVLATDALSALGHGRSTGLGAYVEVGGVSVSRKDVAYGDSDAVQSRFKRGMFTHPATGASEPSRESGGTA